MKNKILVVTFIFINAIAYCQVAPNKTQHNQKTIKKAVELVNRNVGTEKITVVQSSSSGYELWMIKDSSQESCIYFEESHFGSKDYDDILKRLEVFHKIHVENADYTTYSENENSSTESRIIKSSRICIANDTLIRSVISEIMFSKSHAIDKSDLIVSIK